MSETDLKILLALSGAVTGWILAQAATVIRFFWRRRWLRRALLEELYDVKWDLEQTQTFLEELIKIAAIGMIAPGTHTPIRTPIYSGFFGEACSALTREQRKSYKQIHTHIEGINAGFEHLRILITSMTPRVLSKDELRIKSENWMSFLKGDYANVTRTLAHVTFHIHRPQHPDLGNEYGEVAQWIGKQDNIAAANIARVIEEAKGKTLSELHVHMAGYDIPAPPSPPAL